VAAAGVAAVLGLLAAFKYHFLQDLLWRAALGREGASRYVFALGVSYFSFKAIHVLVDAHGRTLKAVEPLHLLSYVLFFPSFISGPINRYPPFAAQLEAAPKEATRRDLAAGGERIVHGLFKKFVLVTIVAPHVLSDATVAAGPASAATVAAGLVATALYFYFDFSAYSDLAIGAARIIGFELPENFDHPFLRRNIRELWANWHMSLTGWLIDYVYWPVVRKLRTLEYFRARPVLLSVVGMNVTFLACGLWHGGAANFVLWGAYHGAGISVLNVYQRQKKRIRVAWAQRWFASRYSRVAGTVATFCFFTLGISLFVLDLGRLRELAALLLRG
jgi:alginate O-acetyltransferase complex protein AlgI